MATPEASTLSIRNIRCFEDERLELRPLTILLGENSSGKSTALACHQVQYGSLGRATGSRNGHSPFNQSPHAMGSFKDIARTTTKDNEPNEPTAPSLVQTLGTLEVKSEFHEKSNSSMQIGCLTLTNNSNGVTDCIALHFNESKPLSIQNNSGGSAIIVEVPPAVMKEHNMSTFLRIRLPSLIQENRWKLPSIAVKKQLQTTSRLLKFIPDINLIPMSSASPIAMRRYTNEDIPPIGVFNVLQSEMNSNRKSVSKEWRRLRRIALNFGKKINLFSDLNMKIHGSERKTFQLIANRDNRDINICDLGNGVWPKVLQVMEVELQTILGLKTFFHIQHPENDAHPRLQTALISYICEKIEDGHRFMVETHSDFILRRLGIEISDGKISPEKVAVAFFDNVPEKKLCQIHNLEFSNTGVVLNQPECYRRFQYAESDRYVWAVNRE